MRLEVEVLSRQYLGRREDRLLVQEDRPEHSALGIQG